MLACADDLCAVNGADDALEPPSRLLIESIKRTPPSAVRTRHRATLNLDIVFVTFNLK